MNTENKLALTGFTCILAIIVLMTTLSLFATNTLNAYHGRNTGIAWNNFGGIEIGGDPGIFLCPSAPIADMFPSLVVDC